MVGDYRMVPFLYKQHNIWEEKNERFQEYYFLQ